MPDIDPTTLLLVALFAGGFGSWLTGQILKTEIAPLTAGLVAGLGGLCMLIPTAGGGIAFFVMVLLFRQCSRADWQDALFAAVGANACTLIVLLYLEVS